jgi:F-type H+-transporting ATPase subunit b
MQIDWITVSAQIVNFLVLVYLLQHFLYKPVVQAMDKREKRITDRLREAEAREKEAKREADEYARKSEQMETERRSLMDRYEQEAREEKQDLLTKAREEVKETRGQWQRQAEQEKREFLADLRRRTGATVTSIARRALADLADAELEERVIDVFVERLGDLDDESRKIFSSPKKGLVVSTAFELSDKQHARVEKALREGLGKDLAFEFRVAPDLLCGIQLGDDGHALGWSLADYMSQITGQMDDAIDNALRRA